MRLVKKPQWEPTVLDISVGPVPNFDHLRGVYTNYSYLFHILPQSREYSRKRTSVLKTSQRKI